MQYIYDFIKIISITGWVVYLIKFMFVDYWEYKLFTFIWVIFFAIMLWLVSIIENWWISK